MKALKHLLKACLVPAVIAFLPLHADYAYAGDKDIDDEEETEDIEEDEPVIAA